VYMEPLIDELVHAWEEGVWTYDRATKTNFRMHVWYQYSMHDLLAYGLFCAWCVHGKFPCPVCKEALRFIWLKKGGKYSSFDKHQQFLPADLERLAPVLLCKLEKIFPPGFFNPMQHLILHLPYEARMGGPCRDVGAIQSRDV
jgi:hypothetical protein